MADDTDNDSIFLEERNADDSWSFIARHDPGMTRDELLEYFRERIGRLWKGLPERPRNVRDLGKYALTFAALTQLLTPDAPEIMDYLRMGARGIAAAAARCIPGGGPVRVELGRFGPIELPPIKDLATEFGTPGYIERNFEFTDSGLIETSEPTEVDLGLPRPDVSLREIVFAYHAAFATDDQPALQLLADVPMDLFADRPPSVEERAYMLSHARGLQLIARGDVAGRKFLFEAINGSNSPEMDEEGRAYAIFRVSPEIELTLLAGQSDQQVAADGTNLPTFDQSLRNALVMHRRYWRDFEQNPGESQTHDPDGFIALGPLAWAAMRYRMGLPVNVTSDYLPRSVIEGRGRPA